MKIHYFFIALGLSLLSSVSFAQRGKIIKTASAVLDPNQDGFVSKTTAGFSNDGYYVDEFEIPMFGIPILGGDVPGDNQAGQSCGTTDVTADNRGFPVYGVLDNNGNLIFRFRVANDKPSVEAYTILLDTDGRVGADDPNSTADNPGFEIDITLIKNNARGIYVYNIDGIQSCPTPDLTYSYATNFQISIADIVSCGDPDYFYDFFVPFSALAARYGITANTEMRFVAVTNVSATCAMSGKISDVGGVDDDDYNGCNSCAFLALTTNQCPTSISNLCTTCAGFSTGITPKPTINSPLKAGEFTASGTSGANATIFVNVFNAAKQPKDNTTTTANGAGNWLANLNVALALGDSVTARAQIPGQCQSGASSSGTSFTIVVQNVRPIINGATSVLSYTENAAPLVIDNTLTLSDADDTELDAATISISANFSSGQDILTFTPVSGITGSYNATTGIISFTGKATLTAYQTLLRSIAYSNSSENPSNATRTITMIVNDGLDNSLPYNRQINVIPVNDAPVAVNDTGTTLEDTPVTLPNVAANDVDVDGTINLATIDLNTTLAGIQNTISTAQGNWSVNGAGQVTYTPTLNFNGNATIPYTVSDNLGATATPANITITVTAVNDAPVATNDSGTTNEDTPVTLINITANDTDVDGTINRATVDLNPNTAGIQTTFSNAQGNWSVNANGDVTYTPTLNFTGVATIEYTVNDNNGATSAPGTISITVVPVNDAPVANNDSGTTAEDTPITLTVTSNDTDVDGTINTATVDLDLLTAGIQNTFTNAQGTWTVNAAGAVTYTPALNLTGIVSRTYTVNDNSGATSNSATITITITAVNDNPVAVNDNSSTNEDTPVSFNITNNDTDVDGTINAASVDLNPGVAGIQTSFNNAQGSWTVTNAGLLTFTPTANFNGTASANYTVNDNTGLTSNVATITIIVNPVNDAPVAVNDNGTTTEDTPVSLTITSNDTDVDGTINTGSVDLNLAVAGIQNALATTQGNWSVNGAGSLTYTPAANFSGTATINYTVNDNSGATSNSALVTITVTAINDAPVANDDSGVTFIDTPVTIFAITSNDTDVDGTIDITSVDLDPATIGKQTTIANANGNWSVNNSGDVTFTPNAGYNGVTSITYTVNDNSEATSNIATISINVSGVNPNPTNPLPVANDDSGITNEDTAIALLVTANDTDANGTINVTTVDLDPATSGIQNSFTNSFGTWTVNATGEVTYTPLLNFNGIATKTYMVNDDDGGRSNIATITITVNPVNDAPVANNDNGTTSEETAVVLLNITANDTDDGSIDVTTVDLNTTTAGIQNTITTTEGIWTVNGSGDVTFTPALNVTGVASITYTVNDNEGLTSNAATISISISPVNDAPTANNDSGSTNEDDAVTLPNITSNDTDPDGTLDLSSIDIDLTTAGIQTTRSTPEGNWSINTANGNLTYTPTANFFGSASISYTINDNSGATSNSATVTITVTSVNDLPVANNDTGATDEDIPVTILSITANDTDVDGTIDNATVDLNTAVAGIQNSITTAQGNWAVNATADVTFTPVLNFNGSASINYFVSDNDGGVSNSATITITVTPVADGPTAVDDIGSTLEDTPVTLPNITANDTDEDGTIDLTTIDIDLLTAGIQNTFVTAQGSWSVNGAGQVTYTPALNFNGTATIRYTVDDNLSLTSNAATITITVNPVNDAPTAVNDTGVTDEDTTITLTTILANDSDVDGAIVGTTIDLNPLVAGQQTTITTAEGTWTVTGSGEITFTPVLDYNGSASVNYTVNDDGGLTSNSATINISIVPVSDDPKLTDLAVTTNEDTPLTGNLLVISDTDPDNTTLVVKTIPTTDPSKGVIEINGDGTYTYTPKVNENGTDQVTVEICDNGAPDVGCATKVISIFIDPINDAPVLTDMIYTTRQSVTLAANVFSTTDSDPEGTTLSVNTTPISTTTSGVLTINANGTFTYKPNVGFFGSDEATIEICDGGLPLPAACATKKLKFTVSPVNYFTGDTIRVTTPEDTPVVFCFDYVDEDGDDADLRSLTQITPGGTLQLFNNVEFCFDFNPTLNFNGDVVWDIELCDVGNNCKKIRAIITVTPVNDAPIARRDTLKVLRNVLANGSLTSFVSDIENDGLVFDTTPVKDVANGRLTLFNDGRLEYLSNVTYRGMDSVVYKVCDTGTPSECTEGTLLILVEDLPLKVYQGVSPNGDGTNDYWRIDGIDFYTNNTVKIFDRFNNEVFEITGYDNQERVWRGEANRGIGNSELPEGTYFYYITLGDGSDPLKGFVVIKRN